jgi:hypothetical protein
MAQTPEQRRYAAKRHRLNVLYRIDPGEEKAIELWQSVHSPYHLLLQRGNGSDDAQIFVDHRHSDGLIRGKLAYLINKALGTIENSYKERTPEILRALADYLENPPAVEVIGPRYGMLGRAKMNKKKKIYGKANS